jgi:hypothetical protein
MSREFSAETIPRGERRVGVYPTTVAGVRLSIVAQVQDGHRYLELILFELPLDRMLASYATWIEPEIERACVNPHPDGPYLSVGSFYVSVPEPVAEQLVQDFGFPFVYPEENDDAS